MHSDKNVALALAGVTVRFGGFTAVERVTMELRKGEIRAILGENGAGKSTLMKVLAGLVDPAEGQITVFGQIFKRLDTDLALQLGIGMVHQHFMLIPEFTVAENFCLGFAQRTGRFVPDLRRTSAEILALATRYGFEIDPNAKVSDLSISAQQKVEILKAIYRGAKILILDEPTAVLTPEETQGLFEMVRSLAAEGTAVLFISHKLHEIMALCQSVTVLRRGMQVGDKRIEATSPKELAHLMVGADLPDLVKHEARGESTLLLSLRGIDLGRGPMDLDVFEGEILGIAGIDGSGQIPLVETIMGLREATGAEIFFENQSIASASIAKRLGLGIAQIPEDRHKSAMVSEMSVAENMALETIDAAPHSLKGWLRPNASKAQALERAQSFDVRMQSIDQPCGSLSGGNQQKVILSRVLSNTPKLILAVYPTRGLDMGATRFLHQSLLSARETGASVLLVSAEIEELLSLSDRIAVMCDSRIAGVLAGEERTTTKIGRLMAGERA